tara:strand:+ start:847 stop:1551 length:705 start_codon:yes stop_codon:yes gene_type:complete
MIYPFPNTSFDGFYKDPDLVREFALSLNYDNKKGTHPGLRSDELGLVDPKFKEQCAKKLLSIFGDFDDSKICNYNCVTAFQKIWRFSSDSNDPVNQGWIHHDGIVNIAAVVYLDPEPINDNGTSFYLPKSDDIKPPDQEDPYYGVLGDKDTSNINDIDWYRKNIVDNNGCFDLTTEVKNCYNRVIVYSGHHMHGQTNYWMPNDDDFRLTQVFFFSDLRLPHMLVPDYRVNRYAI